MAQPPNARGIELDDKASVEDRLSSLLDQLNAFMGSVHVALDGKLSAENFHRQTKVLTVSPTTTYPVAFDCTLDSRPTSIHLAQVLTTSGPAPTGSPNVSQWRMKDAKTIEILAIPGLDPSGTYSLTLTVE
jgi:hypothetical protein